MPPARFRHHHSAGFSLIEVLISMLVLALGMLALAALFISSLATGHGASQRSQATFLAYDIIESMRANRQAALDGAYSTQGSCSGGLPVAGCDLQDWQAQIRRTLPDGTGQIRIQGTRASITLSWEEGKTNADGTPLRAQFITETGV